jgi:SpoVK/Ycf46/Vps4 family AAA+-type ATPase
LAEKTINLTGAIINEICRQVKQLAAREFIAKIDAANLIPILQIRRDHFDVIINTAPRSISDAVIKNFETYTMRLHQLKYYK